MSKKPKHEDEAEVEALDVIEEIPPPVPVADPKAALQVVADALNYQAMHNGPVPPQLLRELYDILDAL